MQPLKLILLGIILTLTSHLFGGLPLFDSMPVPEYHYPRQTYLDIHEKFDKRVDPSEKVVCFDNYYVGLKFDSFKKQNAWFSEVRNHYFSKEVGESFDCDNFAFLYKALFTTASFKKNARGQILVGVILVEHTNEFLGLEEIAGKHALNIIYTSNGWYVVEARTGKFIEYKKYTNPITEYIF
tara:strand:+ start:143 stop:688 length:546 start_codon:yes stop_codon:yes gene_type:complete